MHLLFYNKYFPASKIHAMVEEITNFAQGKEEGIPQAWGRYCALERNCPAHGLKENQLLDIFYNGLTEGSRSYLDSVAGNIFRHRTVEEAKTLLNTIKHNYDDWHIEEDVIHNKRGILELSNEDMKEASRSIKEKGIKTSHLKELSEKGIKLPIDEPCFPIQVHAICSGKGNEEVSLPTEISYVNGLNNSTYDQRYFEHDIKRDIMENSCNIEIILK